METMTKNDFIRWLAEIKEHAKKARPNETGVLVPFKADGKSYSAAISLIDERLKILDENGKEVDFSGQGG